MGQRGQANRWATIQQITSEFHIAVQNATKHLSSDLTELVKVRVICKEQEIASVSKTEGSYFMSHKVILQRLPERKQSRALKAAYTDQP